MATFLKLFLNRVLFFSLLLFFFRYFSVTRPLTYRAKRTTKRAMTMICLAWSISFILWAPAILFWQYIVGERTVPSNECFIQFLSEPIITFCTAIAAFYLPVTIMTTLFWKIFQETEKRAKDIQGLKAGNSQSQNHRSDDGVNKSQKEKSDTTSTQQIHSANERNDEQNQQASDNAKDNSSIPRGMESAGKRRAFLFHLSSHLCRGFRRADNTVPADQSCCDSLNNNDASEDEEEVNDADQTKLATGWIW